MEVPKGYATNVQQGQAVADTKPIVEKLITNMLQIILRDLYACLPACLLPTPFLGLAYRLLASRVRHSSGLPTILVCDGKSIRGLSRPGSPY